LKKFLAAMFALILLTATAQAAEPARVARLPIIFANNAPDAQTCAELELKLERAIHIPTTKSRVEYLPPADSAQKLGDLWRKMRTDNKRAKIQDAMRPLARELDADFIVCPILHRYSENSAIGLGGNKNFIDSSVRVELIVYDRRADELVDKKTSENYRDSYHPLGTAAYLAKICFDKVIDESKLHRRVANL